MTVTRTPAWRALARHYDRMRSRDDAFLADMPQRVVDFDLSLKGLRFNYAFQRVTAETMGLLVDFAKQQQVEAWREKMFSGEKINVTEDRAVLHTALRRSDDAAILVDHLDVRPEICATQNRIAAFVDDVHQGTWTGATGKPFRFVVNIGIGGSDLGPRLAVSALTSFGSKLEVFFVANVDASDLEAVLKKIDPAQTLFVVVSKTFSTQETLMNARTARQWIVDKLGEAAVAKHFVAVSVNQPAVEAFGISAENLFPMWDWVGGRYSLWSAVGVSVALAIGNENFKQLLAGAALMDAHFQSAPLEANMPVLSALLGVWNRNFLGCSMLAVLPYCERLREFPRYLQQLEMESNGKSVTREGVPVDYATVPVLFGECGTVVQHSFLQCLHQGTDVVASDFVVVRQDAFNRPDHHRALLSNLTAQMGALAFGQKEAATPYNIYPGGRPSSLIVLDALDPCRLGMLLALYEHKVFVQGLLWEILSFDQPGVELGKRIAKTLEKGDSFGSGGEGVLALFKTLEGG